MAPEFEASSEYLREKMVSITESHSRMRKLISHRLKEKVHEQ